MSNYLLINSGPRTQGSSSASNTWEIDGSGQRICRIWLQSVQISPAFLEEILEHCSDLLRLLDFKYGSRAQPHKSQRVLGVSSSLRGCFLKVVKHGELPVGRRSTSPPEWLAQDWIQGISPHIPHMSQDCCWLASHLKSGKSSEIPYVCWFTPIICVCHLPNIPTYH